MLHNTSNLADSTYLHLSAVLRHVPVLRRAKPQNVSWRTQEVKDTDFAYASGRNT